MTKSVLVLMCDSGGGHRSVADAIVGALQSLFPDKYRFHLADIMADGFPFPFSAAGRMYGPVVDRLPRSWGLLWHATNGRLRSPLLLKAVSPLASRRLATLVHATAPDVIVSTHPWANHIPAWLRQGRRWTMPLITVVTDPISIHHWWLCPDVDLCLVPTAQAYRAALDSGFEPEKVQVIGMPVALEFVNAVRGKAELREELGLRPDRLTVLMAGGGDGMGNVYPLARAAAQAELDVQLVIVAGRNGALRRKLESTSWEVPTRILGFVDNMADLMHSADLLITKAGPSTISEALSCGLPMLISGALRGQEEGNTEWVAGTGAAAVTPTPEQLVVTLKHLVRNGTESLLRMRQKAHEAARPEAALHAARGIDRLAARAR